MLRAPRPAPRLGSRFAALALAWLVAQLSACHTVTPLALPEVGTRVPKDVPLDLLLEMELYTRSRCTTPFGCPGPYNPSQVEAACAPADRCRARVVQRMDNPHTLLVVAGLATGPAVVKLRYQQPDSAEWLTAQLRLSFVGALALPLLAAGSTVPAHAARLERIGATLTAAGIKSPARCEPEDESRASFVCFGIDTSMGVARHPSCAYTPRCKSTDAMPHGGFTANVKWNDGITTAIEYRANIDGIQELTDVWEASAEERGRDGR